MKQHTLLVSLFEKYHTDILKFLRKKFGSHHDAEDIVQDTFHNVLRNVELEEIEHPLPYIYKTANNLALNRIRSQNQHSKYLNSIDIEESGNNLERDIFAHRALEQVQLSIARMPKQCRTTFEMSRFQNKTYSQISEELGISVSTVEKHIIKALNYLRESLEEEH